MKRIIILLALLGFAVGAGSYLEPAQAAQAKQGIYYCPMHPNYTSDRPGSCPICGMNLVKRVDAPKDSSSKGVEGYAPVHVTKEQQQLMGVRTASVMKSKLTKTIRASGHVSTNRDLYMFQDEYVKAYTEFVTVFKDYRRFKGLRRNWETHRELQLKMYEAEDKLLSLGLSPAQIKKLETYSWRTPWEQSDLLFLKQTDHYWVVAEVFENDLPFVKQEQEAEVDIDVYDQRVKGIIRSIGGNIDPQSRTASVLIELKDYQGQLKGNMFVNVSIPVRSGEALLVPRDAVMDTGLRKLVFVQKANGVFEPKEIKAGSQTDGGVEVISGLKEGELIAVNGNFLLDSESRLQAVLSGQGGGQ